MLPNLINSLYHKPLYRTTELSQNINMNKKILICILIITNCVLGINAQNLRVAFVGDPQVKDETQLEYARKSIYKELIERDDLDLAIFLGDMINRDTIYLSLTKSTLDSLKCPYVCVAGNHDNLEAFKRTFKYVDTCFVQSGVAFILMDNAHSRSSAHTEFQKSQMKWLKEQVSNLDEFGDYSYVCFCTHVPISWMSKTFQDELFSILPTNIVYISGHTHTVERRNLKVQEGVYAEEIIVGASCGTWWRGRKDEQGIPNARMNCGAPRGYFIADFPTSPKLLKKKVAKASKRSMDKINKEVEKKGNGKAYRLSYKIVSDDEDVQAYAKVVGDSLFVNVYGGRNDIGTVKVKIGRKIVELSPSHTLDPIMQEIKAWNKQLSKKEAKARKAEVIPVRNEPSLHLWSCKLDAVLIQKIEASKVKKKIIYLDPYMSFTQSF